MEKLNISIYEIKKSITIPPKNIFDDSGIGSLVIVNHDTNEVHVKNWKHDIYILTEVKPEFITGNDRMFNKID